MRNTCKLVAAWSAIGILLAVGGCGDNGQGTSESNSAAINGGAETPLSASGASYQPKTTEAGTDPLHPVVLIETAMGDITVRLDAEKAEMTVDKFLTYVENKHYDNTIFHQVLKDYVILGGAYTPDLVEKQTDGTIFNEARDAPKNVRGTIAMARQPDVIDSATCQFFFNLTDNPMLDHKDATPEGYGYCVFGKVTEGMEVIDRIANVEVEDRGDFERIPVDVNAVLIKSIRRIR